MNKIDEVREELSCKIKLCENLEKQGYLNVDELRWMKEAFSISLKLIETECADLLDRPLVPCPHYYVFSALGFSSKLCKYEDDLDDKQKNKCRESGRQCVFDDCPVNRKPLTKKEVE